MRTFDLFTSEYFRCFLYWSVVSEDPLCKFYVKSDEWKLCTSKFYTSAKQRPLQYLFTVQCHVSGLCLHWSASTESPLLTGPTMAGSLWVTATLLEVVSLALVAGLPVGIPPPRHASDDPFAHYRSATPSPLEEVTTPTPIFVKITPPPDLNFSTPAPRPGSSLHAVSPQTPTLFCLHLCAQHNVLKPSK